MLAWLYLPVKENYSAVIRNTFLLSLLAHSLLFGALSWAIALQTTQKTPKEEGVSINLEQISVPAPPMAAAPPAPPQEEITPPQKAETPPEASPEPTPQKAVAKKVEPAPSRPKTPKAAPKKSVENARAPSAKTASASAAPANPKSAQVAQALPPKATAPAPLAGANTPKPPYPDLARKRNQEGTVRVRCNVDPSGAVTGVSLAQSSGFKLLDEAALKTVSRWKFKPATNGGANVAGTVVVPVVFKLN